MAVNNLKAGVTYSLRVSMNDFHEQQRDIRLGMNQYLLAEFTMAPLTPSIRIHSDPPGAKIFLDGEDTEKLTPNRISDLEEVLKYKLRLELEGYKTLRMNVSAGEDRETFLDLELEPLPFIQVAESFALDSRVVDEDVFSAILTVDKAIPLAAIEKLDRADDSFTHVVTVLPCGTDSFRRVASGKEEQKKDRRQGQPMALCIGYN